LAPGRRRPPPIVALPAIAELDAEPFRIIRRVGEYVPQLSPRSGFRAVFTVMNDN